MDLPNGLPNAPPVNHAPVGHPNGFAAANVIVDARPDIAILNQYHQVVHDRYQSQFDRRLHQHRERDKKEYELRELEFKNQVLGLQNHVRQQANDHRKSEKKTAVDVEQLREQLADFGARDTALEKEKTRLEHKIEELIREKVVMGEEFKDALTAAEKEKHEADEQSRELTADLATERSGSSDSQSKLDAALEAGRLEKEEHHATRVKLAAEKTARSKHHEKEVATMKEKNSHIEDLLQEIKGLKGDMRKIPLLTVNNGSLKKKIEKLVEANNLLQQKNDQRDLELEASNINVKELTAKLDESKSKCETAEQRSVKDQETTANLTVDLAACRKSAERSRDELRVCRKELLTEQSISTTCEQEVERLKSEVSARTLERAGFVEENDRLKTALTAKDIELAEFNRKLASVLALLTGTKVVSESEPQETPANAERAGAARLDSKASPQQECVQPAPKDDSESESMDVSTRVASDSIPPSEATELGEGTATAHTIAQQTAPLSLSAGTAEGEVGPSTKAANLELPQLKSPPQTSGPVRHTTIQEASVDTLVSPLLRDAASSSVEQAHPDTGDITELNPASNTNVPPSPTLPVREGAIGQTPSNTPSAPGSDLPSISASDRSAQSSTPVQPDIRIPIDQLPNFKKKTAFTPTKPSPLKGGGSSTKKRTRVEDEDNDNINVAKRPAFDKPPPAGPRRQSMGRRAYDCYRPYR
ncbi:hypothetical protein LTR37_004451 [Vermiconidia calcicola]|uniref:Uncharacterized protein n=1 Tax=Vermiconidia calcicola TaxID=1690605 RepID=A0ACC3NMS9_9PEZI|nr:hypothetical protein LTR37_004451 [Vermiconidia calcicola]